MNVLRQPLLLGVFCFVCVSIGAAFSAETKSSAGPEKSAARSDRLLARIASLEKRVAELERCEQATGKSALPSAVRQLPRGWAPREINGMTYYIVPLQNSAASARLRGPSTASGRTTAPTPAVPPSFGQ